MEGFKGTVPLKKMVAPMHLFGLDMVHDAFHAPRLGQKVPQKRIFGVKYLRDPPPQGAPAHTTRLASLMVEARGPRGGGSLKYFKPNIDI